MKLNRYDSYPHPRKGACPVGEGEGSSLRHTTSQAFTHMLASTQDKGQANRLLPSLVRSPTPAEKAVASRIPLSVTVQILEK